jgi:putative transposase
MELIAGEHCKYQIRYHIVWKVKYSRNVLFGPRVTYFKQIVNEIAERYEYTIEAVGTDDNHIHVFAGAHPVVAPAKLIQTIKSITARELFKKFPEIKEFLWGGSLWAIGYYVRTVSDGPIDKVVKRYVEEQNKQRPPRSKRYQLRLVP